MDGKSLIQDKSRMYLYLYYDIIDSILTRILNSMHIKEEVTSLVTLTLSVIVGSIALSITTLALIAVSLFLTYLSVHFPNHFDSVSTINFVKKILTPLEIILIGYYILLNIIYAFIILTSKSHIVTLIKSKLSK